MRWERVRVRVGVLLVLLLLALVATAALAHEVRPAYLELREENMGEFAVLWKTPMRGELRLALEPIFSGRMEYVTPVVTRYSDGAAIQTWRWRAAAPLRGQSLRLAGLETTMTDVLVRIEFADGSSWTHRLRPQAPDVLIPRSTSASEVAAVYLTLGIEHIVLGVDHLLFVLALLLITRGVRRLVKTVSAFTVAHSITLGLATLGVVHVPSAPVEAVIALSIVCVAGEILHLRQGRGGLTARAPWVVAFSFGLLHGFGFAGALSDVGLPERHIPLALLFFNVGVELGQLLFVTAILSVVGVVRRRQPSLPSWVELIPPYAIGSVAMFWVMQRVAAF